MWTLSPGLVVMLAMAVGVAACAPGAAPPPQPARSAATAPQSAAAGPAAPPGRPAVLEKIPLSIASQGATYAPYFVAAEKGYYAAEGFEVEFVQAGGAVATSALLSGDTPYTTSAASVLSAIVKGAPLKVIFTNIDRPIYEIWAISPDVRTLADLQGKTIGVTTRGSPAEIATRMVLKQHGIDPNTVNVTAVGAGGVGLMALQVGSVPAATMGLADVAQLKALGIPATQLADLRKEVRMLLTGLATSDKELQEQRDRAKRFLRAAIKGREYYKVFKEETIHVMMKYNQLSYDANEEDYDGILPTMNEDGTMPADLQRLDAESRAAFLETSPDQIPPVEQMYDYSLAREIYQELRASRWTPER